MTKIFDSEDVPKRRMYIEKVHVLMRNESTEDAVRNMRRNMATALAHKILETEPFFFSVIDDVAGFTALRVEADCFVLTRQELKELMQSKFSDGVNHAQGFYPVPEVLG